MNLSMSNLTKADITQQKIYYLVNYAITTDDYRTWKLCNLPYVIEESF